MACLLIKLARVQDRLAANFDRLQSDAFGGKAMGNHPCEKFPQNNYNGKDTLQINRRRMESSMDGT